MSDIGMNSDVDIGTLLISEWRFQSDIFVSDIGITDVDVGYRDIEIDVDAHLLQKGMNYNIKGQKQLGKSHWRAKWVVHNLEKLIFGLG
jgi:hypothetical protein